MSERWPPHDYLSDWYATNVKDQSFADIGGMWGDYWAAVEAHDAGASPVTMLDLTPPTPECRQAQGDRTIRHLTGDLHDPATLDLVGIHDIVLCSGVIYHCPDPLSTLRCLRAITGSQLVLTCAAMLEEYTDTPQGAIFLPGLTEGQRERLADENPGILRRGILDSPYDPNAGYYNWFWAFTPGALCAMLAVAGFAVTEAADFPGLHIFVAQSRD